MNSDSTTESDSMTDTGRLEAFSDGVFAVAITLLAFDLNATTGGVTLAQRLAAQWPSYAAFLVSFAMIGIMWLSHHQMFRDIRGADHGLIVANLGLLLVVTAFPFPTKVVAEAFGVGTVADADRRTAALFYSLWILVFTLAINALWLWAARGRRLIEPGAPQARIDARTRRSLLGIPTYIVATLVALVSPEASVALDGALALVYLLPNGWTDRLLVPELRAPARAPGDDRGPAARQ